MPADYEIVCLDQNGGIARTIRGTFRRLDNALARAAARAPEDCARILVCAVETDSIVWEGSRDRALRGRGAD
ncbi:MAG TPA: hypothetical protein VHT03_07770 [Rhizomicrobium sp.]|jgi:hypothetical protein|nr:hypothetical protein [Rhizomicrobium sp.]